MSTTKVHIMCRRTQKVVTDLLHLFASILSLTVLSHKFIIDLRVRNFPDVRTLHNLERISDIVSEA